MKNYWLWYGFFLIAALVAVETDTQDADEDTGLVCPEVPEETQGACLHECDSDANCTADLKCCSNGCGMTCVEGVTPETGEPPRLVWTEVFITERKSRINSLPADPLQYVGNSTISTRYKYQLPTRNFLAVAGDYEAGVIFFSDGVTKQIYVGGLQDEATATVIYHGTSQTVEGIAVDWIAKNVYWCDAGYDWIRMANYSGKNARTVVDTGLDKPRDIVVYPQKGFMYWTDWGVNITSISRATLAGDGVAALVTSNLHYPNGLSIDYEMERIFWVDANPSGSRVESVSLDGLQRRLVYTAVQGQSHFFDITPFQNYLFLTDWYGNLQCLHKDSGEHFFSLSLGTRPYSIMTYGKDLQPAYPTSPCLSNPCDQLCVHDSEGEYKCMCADGYRILPNGTCDREEGALIKPKVLLLSRSKLCYYPANFPDISIPDDYEAPCIIQERNHAVALAVDVNANWVFFSDFQLKRLYRVRLVASSKVEQISGAVGSVEGMAVDYINQNLYWTDYKLNHIVVANYDGSYRVTLVDTDIKKPRSLVIHMETRTMFWTESGSPFEIEQADLEGKNRRVVVTLQHSPSGLAYDHITGQLIFGETGSGTILSYNLVTGVLNRLHARFKLVPFYDMEVFGDYLVWTEWGDSNGVHAINLETRAVHQTLLIGEPVYGIRYYSNIKQRANATTGDCGDDNGGCNQLCLATESSHRCMCSMGFVLGADMMTCETGDLQEDNFALVTDSYRKTVYQVDMTSDSFNYTPIALDGLKNPIAVDYDPVAKKIYFTDVLRQTISRANLNGTEMEDIASDNVMTPDGLAVDYISRLVFWTDAGTDTISVSRLDGSYRRSLIKDDLENPRAITLDPFEGIMFWTDWGSIPKIETSYLDGSQRRSIVRGNLTWVNGLALDREASRLYWCDARTDVIETSRYDGSDRYVFLNLDGPAHPFGLGIFGNFIYWTDWVQKGLLRADKTVPLNETTIVPVGPHTFLRLNGLTFYSSGTVLEGETQCSNNGGGCEQICLMTPSGRACRCEDGSGVLEDGVSCQGRDELCPLTVPNGQFSYHCERVPGGQCVVDCEEGYFASLKSFTCQEDLQWNYPIDLICQAVTCPLLNTSANSEVYECKPPHNYNSVCSLRCQLGFTFSSGTEERTCQEDGTWSGEELVCETTTCPALPSPQGGTYQPSSCMQRETVYGDECTVLCSQGYQSSGPTLLTCESSGSWNVDPSLVQCLDTIPPVFSNPCPDDFTVTAPRNSETYLYKGTDLGATDNSGNTPETTYNLPPPVNLPEGIHAFIQTAVDMDNNRIDCSYNITVTVNRCPVLPIPFNSDMSDICPTHHGATCNFQCNSGFQLVGSESLTCEESSAGNFSWTGRVPHCEAVTCEEPVVNEGSVREGCSPPYYPELNCYFRCKRGFEMVRGSNQRTCKVSGEWDGEPIECTRLMCGALAVLDNGSLDPPECTTQGVAVGESCTFICNEGFNLDGPAEVQCTIDGLWTGMDSQRTCQDVNGPHFNGTCPQDMTLRAAPGETGTVVTWPSPRVTDNEGQVLNISSSIQSGSRLFEGVHFIVINAFDVSGNKGSCFFTVEVKVTRCPINESSGEAIQGPCDTLVGSTCSFRCNVGFRLVGSEMLTCTWDGTSEQGTWSGEIPVCEAITCPRFELTAGMHMRGCNFDVERVPYGSICTLFCDKGYYQVFEGIEQKCIGNGTWEGMDITCTPVTCEAIYPSTNSTVSPENCTVGSSAGDVCTFSCDEGFTILGSPNRTCSIYGRWDYDGQVPVCKDIERPTFQNCPSKPVDVQIEDGCQITTPVNLPELHAEDNSGQVSVRLLGLMERQLPVGLYTNFFIAADPSGLQAVCIIVINVTAITCPMPTGVRASSMTCRNLYGSQVSYECPPSFHLRGSRMASCQLDGTWSTPPPICEELDCPPLTLSGYLQQDAPCSADNLGITRCDVVCPFNGYSVRVTCSPEGLWKTPDGTLFNATASSAQCEDNIPPVITCPEQVRVELPADSSTVEFTFGSATAVDTGDLNPVITGPSSPVTLGVGSSEYIFRAEDSSGNSARCSFAVEVVDVTPPVASDCPTNPVVIQNATVGSPLNWTEPTFMDNAGSLARVTVNRPPGAKLSYYGKINIKYIAEDASGNRGICEFALIPTVAGTGCKALPPPVNGGISCSNSSYCVISCNDGYVLLPPDGKPKVTALYICRYGVWNYDSPSPIIPSCAATSTGKMRMDLMRFSLTDATCAGNEEKMKAKFIEVFQTSAFKEMVDNGPKSSASITNIQVECGPSARRRRTVDDNTQANITFIVHAYSNSTSHTLDQAFNLSIPDFFGPTNPTLDLGNGTAVLVPESSVQGLPVSDCPPGQVEIGGICVLCPSGTYVKLRTQSCVKCPVGTYQNQENQTRCTNCDPGQSTSAAGAYMSSMCKHQCQPGEYSFSGLASCSYCPVNTYQPNPHSRGCELCPEGTFTTRKRSAYLSACQAPQPEMTTGSAVLTTTTLRTTTATTQRAATTTPTTNQAMETTTTKAISTKKPEKTDKKTENKPKQNPTKKPDFSKGSKDKSTGNKGGGFVIWVIIPIVLLVILIVVIIAVVVICKRRELMGGHRRLYDANEPIVGDYSDDHSMKESPDKYLQPEVSSGVVAFQNPAFAEVDL